MFWNVQDGQAVEAPIRGANRMQAGLRRRRAGVRRMDDEDEGIQGGRDDDGEEGGAGEGGKAMSRRDAYEAQRAAKDAEREAAEAAQEAEMRRAAEERAKREAEEAEKWMHTFTLEDAGEEALSKEDAEVVLTNIADYLKKRKTVGLEELAAEFGMKTADAVEKVKYLEEEKRITGIMDDRGKFIFITEDEMKAVANFVRSRGRIAIGELALNSSSLIDLEGEQIAVDDINILADEE